MPQSNFPQWYTPAFPIFQIHQGVTDPSHFINIRAIHNKRPFPDPKTGRLRYETEAVFNQNFSIDGFKEQFINEVYPKLVQLNLSKEKPCNIYYSINPRSVALGNKKEHCPGFRVFCLDMDGHKTYTKEQRLLQIQFLCDYGMMPNIVVDSGNGYHVYWILQDFCPTHEGEAILKRMIQLSGCKEGGNCSDVTRILRLPGFYNVKEWYKAQDLGEPNPVCFTIHPINYLEIMDERRILDRWDWRAFHEFPPCELGHIADYRDAALKIAPLNDIETANAMREIVIKAGKLAAQQKTDLSAQNVFTKHQKEQAEIGATPATKTEWKPTLTLVPPIEDIKFGRGKNWMKKYCVKGHDALTEKELTVLAARIHSEDTSASTFESKIIYELIRLGYTEDAVRDFWLRPELKLYRPDKEKNSPNYFTYTYNKMLGMVLNSQTDATATGSGGALADLIHMQGCHTYWKRENGMEAILNAELKLKGIYLNKDLSGAEKEGEKEYYAVEATAPSVYAENGTIEMKLLLPRSAFNGVAEFKKFMHGPLTYFCDHPKSLMFLLNHLISTSNIKPQSFHFKVIYENGNYYFPKLIINKDEIIHADVTKNYPGLITKYDQHKWFVDDVVPIEDVKAMISNNWHALLHCHLPGMVTSMLGMLGLSAFRSRIEAETDRKRLPMPILNLRGASTSGKTETALLLASLLGLHNHEHKTSTRSTTFGIEAFLDQSRIIPLIIDEFKKTNEDSIRNMARLRDLLRQSYSGETVVRGRSDQSTRQTRLHGALIVIGESPIEDEGGIAEITRLIVVHTDDFDVGKYQAAYKSVQLLPWYQIGPYFYQFLASLNPKTELDRITDLADGYVEDAKKVMYAERTRIAFNLALITHGCELWDRFIKTLVPNAPSINQEHNIKQTLLAEIKEWMAIQEHTGSGNELGEATSINDALSFLRSLHEMLSIRSNETEDLVKKQVFFFQENTEAGHLDIRFHICHELYRLYCLRTKKMYYDKNTIRAQLRAAYKKNKAYVMSMEQIVKADGKSDGKSERCIRFNMAALAKMGIWIPVTGTVGEKDKLSEPGTNRIKDMFN